VDDLGAHRLRNVLDDVGWFRRIKGTAEGAKFFIKSISGSDALIDTGARTMDVYAYRVNHMLDPQNTASVTDRVTSRLADVDEADNPGQYEFYDVVATPTADTTIYRIDSPVTVVRGDILSFSVHSGIGTDEGLSAIKWARVTDTTTFAIKSIEVNAVYRHGDPYFDLDIDYNGTVLVEFMVDTRVLTYVNSHFLLEKNGAGEYFDGDTKRGGWLIGIQNISDYRWEDGFDDQHNSRSLYNEDYERTKQVVNQVFTDVLPIDQASYVGAGEWTVTYNNVP